METVNNLTSAASRAIWGDQSKNTDTAQTGATNEEPRSGEIGNVSAGEPYDKGNVETHNPTSETSSSPPSSSNDTSGAGVGSTPSVAADPSSAPHQTQKQQGADKSADAPQEGSEEHNRIAETKKEAEDAAKADTSGPGPKPLSEVKKDGGATTGGNAGGDGEDGPQKESHGEGTGEKYVKSSGLKADGGDFDAAKPGAAKEADRLLETKGIHRETPGKTEPADDSSKADSKDTSESGGKLSALKDKIKAKLHKS